MRGNQVWDSDAAVTASTAKIAATKKKQIERRKDVSVRIGRRRLHPLFRLLKFSSVRFGLSQSAWFWSERMQREEWIVKNR